MKLLAQINFKEFNEKIFGPPNAQKPFSQPDANLNTIINELMKYLFPFAGLLLLLYLIIGGFGYLTSGGDPKKTESAQHQITNALIGFLILFLSFWIVEIFGFMFNLDILKK